MNPFCPARIIVTELELPRTNAIDEADDVIVKSGWPGLDVLVVVLLVLLLVVPGPVVVFAVVAARITRLNVVP